MPRLAVLGRPIAHSRSPAMQNAALRELGLSPEWSYEAIEVAPEDFERLVRGLPAEGFAGANVTVPHKLAALAVADAASAAAREIGAANTLSFAAGEISADNTDAAGLLDSLPEPPGGKRALLLGAGGSARAVAWALATQGARLTIWNRTAETAERLAEDFGAESMRANGASLPAGDFELIVNATTVGMGTEVEGDGAALKALQLDADSLSERHIVVDLAYGSADTELVRAARARGATVIDGIEVLVRQGAASLRIWTGMEPPVETMRRVALS